MDKRTKWLFDKTKGKRIGLFIDNSNWFYPQKELGWRISFSKIKRLLTKYYTLTILKIYAGTPLDIKDKKAFDRFIEAIEKHGYEVFTKPLKKIWINRQKKLYEHKCNFDVEIALDVARNINIIDIIIIGSGDSDFLEIKNYALENKKGFIALCFEKGVAWEIRKCYHIFLEKLQNQIKQ